MNGILKPSVCVWSVKESQLWASERLEVENGRDSVG